MDEKTEELIKRIAAKHHIALDETDPIMIVPTMIEFIFEESQRQQEAALDEFKSELQSAAMQWDFQVKDKADRVLNASLKASKEAMQQILSGTGSEIAGAIRKQVDLEMNKIRAQSDTTKRLVFWNIAAASITLLASAIAFATVFM